MENFTPVSALLGGALIGLSAVLLMGLHGRIAGISGILSGAATSSGGERLWRLSFVLGLVAAPILCTAFLAEPITINLQASAPVIVLGGLLVGLGTRLGSGCTSGHGVCGLARLSPRSMAAVPVFMAVAVATLTLTKMVGG